MIKTMCTTWIKCPICGGKTRVKIKEDTELRNFPLYCPKCRNETLIDENKEISLSSKSQTHRRRADDRQYITAIIGSFFIRSIVYEYSHERRIRKAA